MSEPTSRLNLIQRAMQRAALERPPAVAGETVLREETNGRAQSAFAEPMPVNGAAAVQRKEPEPVRAEAKPVRTEAEPVQLDYAKLRASRISTPDNKNSSTYNEFRSLKRKLLPMTRDPNTGAMTRNVIMVTSALPGEGKTFTVMNLAIGLAAERNLNVILVDGDVVRGSVANYFHGEDQDGLVELLTEKRERIDEVLHPCADLPGLHVLFAGKHHETTPELLASRRMADICAMLSKRFQNSIVIFDTPPVLAASEPASMVAHAHHLIMLVASGQASRHQVEEALAEVSSCPSISLLFNRSPQWERPLSYPYYYYGYGRDKS